MMKKWSRHLLAAGALALGMSAAHANDNNTLYFYNWTEYVPPGLLEQFTKETGIKVIVSSVNHKISVYDPQMKNTPGMAARVFSAIAASDADIRLITTSEVEISLLVTEADYDTVLEAIEEAVNAK